MVRRLNEAENNINNIRNLTNAINKIKKYGEVALDRYKIMDLDKFDSIRSNMSKQSYLLNIITDLENIRNDIKSTGSSKFRRKDIVDFLKDIGFDVTEDKYSFIVESKSRTRKRSIKEGDSSKKTNYAVQVRDMNSGYIHLFTGTKADCLKLEKILDDFTREMEDWQDDFEYESNMEWLNDEVLSNYGHIEEINYREIDDNNNYWDYDQPYHIINDYYFDMYL